LHIALAWISGGKGIRQDGFATEGIRFIELLRMSAADIMSRAVRRGNKHLQQHRLSHRCVMVRCMCAILPWLLSISLVGRR
jgi:hypothetical protein